MIIELFFYYDFFLKDCMLVLVELAVYNSTKSGRSIKTEVQVTTKKPSNTVYKLELTLVGYIEMCYSFSIFSNRFF